MTDESKEVEESEEKTHPFCVKCKSQLGKGIKFCPKCHGLVLYFTKKQIAASKQQKSKPSDDETFFDTKPVRRTKRNFPLQDEEDDFNPNAAGRSEPVEDDDYLD